MRGSRRSGAHVLDDRLMFADSPPHSTQQNFPDDYCQYCNCSIPRVQDDRMWVYDEMPVSMPSVEASDEAPAAEDFSGTNNQVSSHRPHKGNHHH